MSSPPPPGSQPVPASDLTSRVFRLPRMTYLVVLFLAFCVLPLAFTADGNNSARAVYGPRMLLILIPIAAAFFIARTATVIDAAGIRVRALLGTRTLGWDELRGLSVSERSVYAVAADGSVRLPCVRISDLASIAAASGGRLPDVPAAPPKFAPARRRR